MNTNRNIHWKMAIWAAIPVMCVCLYPQILMWIKHGSHWQGSYAVVQKDEWVYSAYLNALINGRPRRNDPYTGKDDSPETPQPESYFSIQFVPAYILAIPARTLRISSSTVFVALMFIIPLLTTLVLFWLIFLCTDDEWLAVAGSIFVICFSALAAREGLVSLFREHIMYTFIPFLRRYQPAVAFPLIFLMCGLVWKALNSKDQRDVFKYSSGAGIIIGLLIFSYFYLWTTAVAWLIWIVLLWCIARPDNWQISIRAFIIIGSITILSLIPYLILLSHRSEAAFTSLQILYTRVPEFNRGPQWIGIIAMSILGYGIWRGRINWREPKTLFTLSFALLPFAVFNQQILTGRSLQSFHYELFIANYMSLIGLVLAIHLVWKGASGNNISRRILLPVSIFSLMWGALEIMAPTKVLTEDNKFTEELVPLGKHLAKIGGETQQIKGLVHTQLVLSTDVWTGIQLPTFAPQALFWTPTFATQNITEAESRERFYQHLYYTGMTRESFFKELESKYDPYLIALFGQERVVPGMIPDPKPITKEDILLEVDRYGKYVEAFSREKASSQNLSYVVVMADKVPDFSNLDRWYERSNGERISKYLLYYVRLRP
jgi:hypothetical protein